MSEHGTQEKQPGVFFEKAVVAEFPDGDVQEPLLVKSPEKVCQHALFFSPPKPPVRRGVWETSGASDVLQIEKPECEAGG